MAFFRASIGGGGGGGTQVQTGSFTTNAQTAVSIPLNFAPDRVIVYQNINPRATYATIAVSLNQGAFEGYNMQGTSSGSNIGTFTWSGNTFTHKAVNANYANKTAYYVALKE